MFPLCQNTCCLLIAADIYHYTEHLLFDSQNGRHIMISWNNIVVKLPICLSLCPSVWLGVKLNYVLGHRADCAKATGNCAHIHQRLHTHTHTHMLCPRQTSDWLIQSFIFSSPIYLLSFSCLPLSPFLLIGDLCNSSFTNTLKELYQLLGQNATWVWLVCRRGCTCFMYF